MSDFQDTLKQMQQQFDCWANPRICVYMWLNDRDLAPFNLYNITPEQEEYLGENEPLVDAWIERHRLEVGRDYVYVNQLDCSNAIGGEAIYFTDSRIKTLFEIAFG